MKFGNLFYKIYLASAKCNGCKKKLAIVAAAKSLTKLFLLNTSNPKSNFYYILLLTI